MKILGKDISFQWPVRAAAPAPARQVIDDGALTNILPQFGTKVPIQRPIVETSTDLEERSVHSDPRDMWYLNFPAKLTPKQVLMILRSALGGDVWQQWQLCSLMLDTWPMFRKCAHEIRNRVAGVKFKVTAYANEGEKPTPKAEEKAALVRRAMRGFKPDPFSDEEAFGDMVYDLTDAMLNGMTLVELLWHERVSKQRDILPRASCWVHPRHFTFTNDGKIAVFDAVYNRLVWTNQRGQTPDPNKFICAQFKSRSGTSLGAGLLRPLALCWTARTYGWEWALEFAQKYGNPFLDATYPGGTQESDLNILKNQMKNAGAQGWCVRREGTTLNIHPAQSLGPDNAIAYLVREADEQCQILLLGQTATTQGTPGKLGGEEVHGEVKRENVEGVANWIGSLLTEQFAPAVLRVNYGDDEECPTVEPDFTEVSSPEKQAARWATLTGPNMPPTQYEEFCRDNSLTPVKTGDIVIHSGRVGKMGSMEEEISMEKQAPPAFVPKEGEGEPSKSFGKGRNGQEPKTEGKEAGEEGVRATDMRRVLAAATDDEFAELRSMVVRAHELAMDGRLNGEWGEVQAKLELLKGRRR